MLSVISGRLWCFFGIPPAPTPRILPGMLRLAQDTHPMPTRNVNLTDELERFVLKKVKSGRYEDASDVVRAALRTLEREEQQYEAKLRALRVAIDDGDASGIAHGNAFTRVRERLGLP
ncbi:MAG: type II toxin-antitoxin system ParD family antitoxin, partial [Bryobacteraceae bacterium]